MRDCPICDLMSDGGVFIAGDCITGGLRLTDDGSHLACGVFLRGGFFLGLCLTGGLFLRGGLLSGGPNFNANLSFVSSSSFNGLTSESDSCTIVAYLSLPFFCRPGPLRVASFSLSAGL